MLALRNSSLDEPFGVFEAVTSLSQVSASSDLASRLRELQTQTRDSVSRIEMSFFGDGRPKEFGKLFHRPIRAGLLTLDPEIAKHAASHGLEPISRASI